MGFVRPVDLETFGFIYFFIIKDMDREKEDFSLDTRVACSSRCPNYTLRMDLSMFFLWNVRQASWISLTRNAVKAITSINQLEQRKQTKKLAKDKPNKKNASKSQRLSHDLRVWWNAVGNLRWNFDFTNSKSETKWNLRSGDTGNRYNYAIYCMHTSCSVTYSNLYRYTPTRRCSASKSTDVIERDVKTAWQLIFCINLRT